MRDPYLGAADDRADVREVRLADVWGIGKSSLLAACLTRRLMFACAVVGLRYSSYVCCVWVVWVLGWAVRLLVVGCPCGSAVAAALVLGVRWGRVGEDNL